MSNAVNNKDRPQNKLVDGKTLEHVLRLLKGYIEEKDDKTFNNNNVNAVIKSGVKNIPL